MPIFQASGLASCAATFCWCFGFPWVQRGLFPLRSLRLPSAISPSVTVTFMSKIVHRVVCCQPYVAVFLSALVGAAHMPQNLLPSWRVERQAQGCGKHCPAHILQLSSHGRLRQLSLAPELGVGWCQFASFLWIPRCFLY